MEGERRGEQGRREEEEPKGREAPAALPDDPWGGHTAVLLLTNLLPLNLFSPPSLLSTHAFRNRFSKTNLMKIYYHSKGLIHCCHTDQVPPHPSPPQRGSECFPPSPSCWTASHSVATVYVERRAGRGWSERSSSKSFSWNSTGESST